MVSLHFCSQGIGDLFPPTTMEIAILQGHVPVFLDTPFYTHLCSYLTKPVQVDDLNVQLLAGQLNCSENEVGDHLGVDCTSSRVVRVSYQLYNAGKHLEAGSFLLTSQVFLPALTSIPSALSMKWVLKD